MNQIPESSWVSQLPILVIGSYLVVLLFLGWMGHRLSKAGEEDYYLAGREQGWLISSLTIIATFLSSFALLGAPGMVYREGVVFALVSLNVPVAGFCIALLGPKIWKIGRERGFITQADMICDHYGSRVSLRLLVTLVGILFVVPYVMMQIKAGGDLAVVLFPDHTRAFEIGAVVLAAITAIYIMVGGMRSVAWTDALQCVLLVSGMVLAAFSVLTVMGGTTAFLARLKTLPASSLTIPGNSGQWKVPFLLTVCLFMPIGGIIQPAQWMRFYSATGPAALRRSSLIFTILLTGSFLLLIMPIGLAGQLLYPLQFSDGGVSPHPDVGAYDQILVYMAQQNLPAVFGAMTGELLSTLLVVAIMAASMSTADSNLHALSALVTRDVYVAFFRRSASELEKLWFGRIVILLATAGALWVILLGQKESSSLSGFIQMIVGLALFAVAFSVQLLPITIDILYLQKGTKLGAALGLTAGLLVALMFTSLFPLIVGLLPDHIFIENLSKGVAELKSALPMHASAWGLIPNVIIMVLVSNIENRIRKRR